MNREYIGLEDKNGTKIYVGDIVKFYFDADLGPSKTNKDNKYTEIIDVVIRHDKKEYIVDVNTMEVTGEMVVPGYYFLCEEIDSVACAWMYNEYCEVIGHKEPPEVKFYNDDEVILNYGFK